jgi:hypothetical protein
MAKKSFRINFTPVAGLALPAQIVAMFYDTAAPTVLLAQKPFVCDSAAAKDYDVIDVDGVPEAAASTLIKYGVVDNQGALVTQIVSPGVPPSTASVVAFNGFKIGVV